MRWTTLEKKIFVIVTINKNIVIVHVIYQLHTLLDKSLALIWFSKLFQKSPMLFAREHLLIWSKILWKQ